MNLIVSTVFGAAFATAATDHEQIEDLILSVPRISVANESANPNGDSIGPLASLGFEGSGASRREVFQEKFRITKIFEKWTAFNPNADVLYPGALVQGSSLQDGVLSPIETKRTPLTITVTDLIASNPGATYSATLTSPSLATVKDAAHKILTQNLSREQPAKLSFSQTSVSSVDQGFIKLGVSHKWLSGSVSGAFQKDTDKFATSVMVRFVQSYYTISANSSQSPAAFIAGDAKFKNFKNYVGNGNPPAYISTVTYGRELWLLIQSNRRAEDVTSALNVAYSAGLARGAVNLNIDQKQLLEDSSIQIMMLGGGGTPAVQMLTGNNLSKLETFLLEGANYSSSSPGVAISYTARYLRDNSAARISSSTDFTVRTDKSATEAISLTSATVTWDTNDNDKNFDTSANIEVRQSNGDIVANISCCGADRANDNWDTGRSETRNLKIVQPTDKFNLAKGSFSATVSPKRSDKWEYTATVRLNFSDNTSVAYSCSGRMSCGQSW